MRDLRKQSVPAVRGLLLLAAFLPLAIQPVSAQPPREVLAPMTSSASEGRIAIETSAAPSKITIGDVITYRINVTYPEKTRILDNLLLTKIGPFEILDNVPGERQILDGMTSFEDLYRISIYDTGEYSIPAFKLRYRTEDGQERSLQTEPLSLSVEPVAGDLEQAQDIRDIKPPVVLGQPLADRLLPWAMVVVAVLMLFFFYRWLRSRPKRTKAAPAPPPRPAHELAFEALSELRKDREGLIEKRDFEAFSVRVSWILRHYLGNRYDVQAIDLTTSEILDALQPLALPEDTFKEFLEFFDDCDLVKFAKEALDRKDMLYLIDLAWKLVDATRIGGRTEQTQARFQENGEAKA